MCGIWDWQSTIVKDLNDSQDPKHTLFCREIVFVAIYALFQTTNVRFLPVFLIGWLIAITFLLGGPPESVYFRSASLSPFMQNASA